MDPWNSGANLNGIYPNYEVPYNDLDKPNYIYISHIHDDHYDQEIIKSLPNTTKYLIKNFNDEILRNKLINFGINAENIINIDPWTTFYISDKTISIMIIPQISSNSAMKESHYDYGMDTAIFLKHHEKCFFNQVDMIINNNDLPDIIRKAKSRLNFKNIDIYCRTYGAGSEYPQCFLNIDRKKESDVVKNKILSDFCKSTEIVDPEIVIPAGASFQISKERSKLSKYIAVPSNEEIINFWRKKNMSKTTLALTEGGGKVFASNIMKTKNSFIELGNKYKKYQIKNKKHNYYVEITNNLKNKLFKRTQELFSFLSKRDHDTSQLKISIIKNRQDTQKLIDCKNPENLDLLNYIYSFSSNKSNKLTIYFEIKDY